MIRVTSGPEAFSDYIYFNYYIGRNSAILMGLALILVCYAWQISTTKYIPLIYWLAVTAVATLMALLMGYPLYDAAFGRPFSNYYFWATLGTLVVILVYIMLCFGGIVFFWKTRHTRNWNPLVHVVIPLIGAVVFAAAWYGSVHPTPPGILKWTPYVAVAWVIAGVAVLLWLRARRPDSVAQIGSILGEEGGTDAKVLDRT